MAYFSTPTSPERRNVTGKNRVWDFFRLPNETHLATRRQPAQPRLKIGPAAMKSASGIPYWPSRDPIGEKGGINLYEHTHNNAISYLDKNGLSSCKCGPDISTVFYSYLRYVSGYLQRLPDNVKGIVDGLAKMQQIGMNIDFWSVKSKPGCGTGDCAGTVYFSGKCVRATVINNILFGVVASAMNIPEGLAGDGADLNNLMRGNGFEGREQFGAYHIGYQLWKALNKWETWGGDFNKVVQDSYIPDGPFIHNSLEDASKAFKNCESCGETLKFNEIGRVGIGFFMGLDKNSGDVKPR